MTFAVEVHHGVFPTSVVALVIFLGLLYPGYVLISRPVLRRYANRQVSRRPKEAALIIVGAMFGTALVTSSLIVGDGLRASVRRSAFTQLGPVDEVVTTPSPGQGANLAARVIQADIPRIDSVMGATISSGAVRGDNIHSLAQPSVQIVEFDFNDARYFGGDPTATGISGVTPNTSEVAISADLARILKTRVGEKVTLYAYGKPLQLTVKAIVPKHGLGGLLRVDSPSGDGNSLNAFVAPGTVERMYNAANASAETVAPQSVALISNEGGVITGKSYSSEVTAGLNCSLGLTPSCAASDSPKVNASVLELKSDLLRTSNSASSTLTQMFSGLAAFSVVAGIFLLVTILVMLAQDRKSQYGTMRALGMTTRDLGKVSFLEGWIYALASSILGAAAGVLVARAVIVLAAHTFQSIGGQFTFDLVFSLKASSVAVGFAIGFLVSVLTVIGISMWSSRLNIISAIRDLPDSRRKSPGFLSEIIGGLVVFVGVIALLAAVYGKDSSGVIVAPAVMVLGFYDATRHWIPVRPLVSALAGAMFFWCMFGAYWAFPHVIKDVQMIFFVTSGLVAVVSAILIFAVNQSLVSSFVSFFAPKSNLSVRIGFGYTNARRVRTGLIMAMYSLVIFCLSFATIYEVLFSQQLSAFSARFGGGYEVVVDASSSNALKVDDFAGIKGVKSAYFQSKGALEFSTHSRKHPVLWQAVGAFNGNMNLPINSALPEYQTSQKVLDALQSEPDVVVVDQRFLQTSNGPSEVNAQLGESIGAKSPVTGNTTKLRVIAFSEINFGESVALVSAATLTKLDGIAPSNRAFLKLSPGSNPDQVASLVQSTLLAQGVRARSVKTVVRSNMRLQIQMLQLFQAYMALGLVVGIAGLGVVMIRSVRERRRQIGMLRAMGFAASAVRHVFEVESAFIAIEGIVIGVLVGTLLVWRLNSSKAFGGSIPFNIPWVQLATLGFAATLASLLATAYPAYKASKIKPAVALRLVD